MLGDGVKMMEFGGETIGEVIKNPDHPIMQNVARHFASRSGDTLTCVECGVEFVRGEWCFYTLCDPCFFEYDKHKYDVVIINGSAVNLAQPLIKPRQWFPLNPDIVEWMMLWEAGAVAHLGIEEVDDYCPMVALIFNGVRLGYCSP